MKKIADTLLWGLVIIAFVVFLKTIIPPAPQVTETADTTSVVSEFIVDTTSTRVVTPATVELQDITVDDILLKDVEVAIGDTISLPDLQIVPSYVPRTRTFDIEVIDTRPIEVKTVTIQKVKEIVLTQPLYENMWFYVSLVLLATLALVTSFISG